MLYLRAHCSGVTCNIRASQRFILTNSLGSVLPPVIFVFFLPPLLLPRNLKPAAIKKGTSYVPSGLTAAQYASVRSKDYKTSEANYKRNAAKGGGE